MKATYGEVNGEGREIFKDPVTDDGTKKSAKGLLHVEKVDNYEVENGETVYKGYDLVLTDQVSWEKENTGYLTEVFRDGKLLKEQTLSEIRSHLSHL